MRTSTKRRRTFGAALIAVALAAASVFAAAPAVAAEPPQGPEWVTTTLGDLTVGQDVGAIQLEAAPVDYFAVTAGALPAGLRMGPAGTVTGTPVTPGPYSVQIAAVSNDVGAMAYQVFSGTVNAAAAAVTWVTASLPGAVVGTAYSQTLLAQNATWYNVSSGALPAGLTLIGDTISGTPTVAGSFPITVEAWGNGRFDLADFTVEVTAPAPVDPWVTKALPPLEQHVAADAVLLAEGATSFGVVGGRLPEGVTLAYIGAGQLRLSGTPTVAGAYDFTLRAFVNGQFFTQQFTGSVKWAMPSFGQPLFARAKADQQYSAQVIGANWSEIGVIAGKLPTGLSMSGSGVISGVPTVAGAFQFMVTLSNPDYPAGQVVRSFIIFVDPPAPQFTDPFSPLDFQVGRPFSYLFTSDQSATFSIVSGTTPAGTSLSEHGILSGTPTQSGPFWFTVLLSNQYGTALRMYGGAVSPAPVIPDPIQITSPASLPEIKVGAPFEFTFTASRPAAFSVEGDLPAGLTLTEAGLLSGIPTVAGEYSFTVRAVDGLASASAEYDGVVLGADTVPATPVNTTPATAAKAGAELEVTGAGFTAGEVVEVWVRSTPVRLGELTADAAGNLRGTFTLPANLEPGVHHIVLVDEDGVEYVSGDLTVIAADGTVTAPAPVAPAKPAAARNDPQRIPELGVDSGNTSLLVGVLLLVGAALTYVGRRRRAAA